MNRHETQKQMAGDWQQFIFRGAQGGTPAVRQHRGRGEPIPVRPIRRFFPTGEMAAGLADFSSINWI